MTDDERLRDASGDATGWTWSEGQLVHQEVILFKKGGAYDTKICSYADKDAALSELAKRNLQKTVEVDGAWEWRGVWTPGDPCATYYLERYRTYGPRDEEP